MMGLGMNIFEEKSLISDGQTIPVFYFIFDDITGFS